MSTYQELIAQRTALEEQIKAARAAEVAGVVAQIKDLMALYGLTASDISSASGSRAQPRKTGSVAPKYRDPSTGQTWTGRGKAPKWIEGKDREQFLIAAA